MANSFTSFYVGFFFIVSDLCLQFCKHYNTFLNTNKYSLKLIGLVSSTVNKFLYLNRTFDVSASSFYSKMLIID